MSGRGTGTGGDVWDEPSSPRHDLEVPEGERYVVGAVLGEGGMGRVVEAWDRRLRRHVALKTASPGTAAEARLVQEAWIGAQLVHPGVVPILDAGVLPDGRRFLAMRRVRGSTLAEAVAEGGAPRLDLLHALADAAEAVGCAHDLGIVHRDLTPSNLFVDEDGRALVADWGLARPLAGEASARWSDTVLSGDTGPRTVAGVVLGTPGFMSPEQALAAPVDPRSDVWALGAVLHTLLCGVPPFGHLEGDARQRALGHADVPDPRERAADLPDAVVAVCLSALARDPDQRPPDGNAFAFALREALRPRRPVWPRRMAGAAVVGVVAVASGLAGRAAAPASEDATTLAALHLERGRRAADHARWPEAEWHAASSLVLQPSPEARGILAGAAAGGRPRRVATAPLPAPCRRARLLDDALVCADGAEVGVWSLDGEERWRRLLEAPSPQLVVDGDLLGVWSENHDLVVLDAATGDDRVPWRRGCCVWALDAGRGGAFAQERERLVPLLEVGRELPAVSSPVGRVDRAVVWREGDGALLGLRDRWTLVAWEPEEAAWREVGVLDAPRLDDDVERVRLTRSGRTLMTTFEGYARVGARSDAPWLRLPGRAIDADVSPDGVHLLAAVEGSGVVVLDIASGATVAHLPDRPGRAVRWRDDATFVVVSDAIERWSLGPQRWARRLDGGAGVTALALSAEPSRLAISSADQAFWLDPPARVGGRWPRAGGVMKGVAWSPDGARAVAVDSQRPALRVLDPASGDVTAVDVVPGGARRVAWPAPEAIAFAMYGENGPQIYAPDRDVLQSRFAVPGVEVRDLVVDARGITWWLGFDGRVVRVDPGPEGGVAEEGRAPRGAATLAAAPDGTLWASDGGALHRRGAGDSAWSEAVAVLPSDVVELAVSPDGAWVVAGLRDGSVAVLDREAGLRAMLRGHDERVPALAFDGDLLFTGAWDGWVRTWDLGALEADPTVWRGAAAERWGLGPAR